MPRVLVVDDDPCYLMILDRLCRSCGADVVTAETADEARAALRKETFDLMLFDLQMPGQEGLPLIAEVENNAGLASRAVVVTGYASIAPVFTKLRVIDKGKLDELPGFLRRMLA
ncbi:MAG TPA: response regulator [Thermoanaerobaculia bacterium]|jgi:two-component system response regulator HydG|nr:response regulator [Thermoanaerobaculia bacterium]